MTTSPNSTSSSSSSTLGNTSPTYPSSSSSSVPSSSAEAEGTSCTIFGTLLIGASIFAYHRTRSNVFLAGGVGVGAAYLLSGAMIQTNRELIGHTAAASASMVILTTGVSRYRTTRRAMPALPFVTLGILSTLYHLERASSYKMDAGTEQNKS